MNTEQLGPYRLNQREGVFPLGTDTLCLAGFVQPRRGDRVCDLGCGSGALLLLLAAQSERLSLTGVELIPAAAELAQSNLEQNHLSGTILLGDLRDPSVLPPAGQMDLVVSNPPYYAPDQGKQAEGGRGTARSQQSCTLEDVCRSAARLLRNGGRFCLCWPARDLANLMEALRGSRLEPKRLQLVQHGADTSPFLALVEGRRQGRPGLQALPVRILT